MTLFLNDKRDPIFYNSIFREYYIKLNDQPNIITFSYCPWCGKKLLDSLRANYFDIIFDELKLDGDEDIRLPVEFKSDEWWKKRGL